MEGRVAVGIVLDPVEGGVEEHQDVVVLEENFAHPIEVLIGRAVRGQMACSGRAEGSIDEVCLGEVDGEVQGELFGGAASEHVAVVVNCRDAVGEALEAGTNSRRQARSCANERATGGRILAKETGLLVCHSSARYSAALHRYQAMRGAICQPSLSTCGS